MNICPECGAVFKCGMASGDSDCWCFDLPTKDIQNMCECVCEECLTNKKDLEVEEWN